MFSSHCYQSLKWKSVMDTRTFWKILPEYGEQQFFPVFPSGEDWLLARNASPPPRGAASSPTSFSGSVNKP